MIISIQNDPESSIQIWDAKVYLMGVYRILPPIFKKYSFEELWRGI